MLFQRPQPVQEGSQIFPQRPNVGDLLRRSSLSHRYPWIEVVGTKGRELLAGSFDPLILHTRKACVRKLSVVEANWLCTRVGRFALTADVDLSSHYLNDRIALGISLSAKP